MSAQQEIKMSEQVKLIEELREAAGDHAHGEGYLAGLLKRGAAAIKDLHAEAEALRAELAEEEQLRNRLSSLLSETAIALRGPEPALTRYSYADIPSRVKSVVEELETARGLIGKLHSGLRSLKESVFPDDWHGTVSMHEFIDALLALTATPAPEEQASGPYASVADALAQRYPKPSPLKDCNVTYSNSSRPLAEQGERQEAVTMRDVMQALESVPGAPVLTSNMCHAIAKHLNANRHAQHK